MRSTLVACGWSSSGWRGARWRGAGPWAIASGEARHRQRRRDLHGRHCRCMGHSRLRAPRRAQAQCPPWPDPTSADIHAQNPAAGRWLQLPLPGVPRHADLRATRATDGSQPTGAIRGMINMMQKLRKDVPRAPYAACVFDAKGPTFRDALYPEYKAQRAPCRMTCAARSRPSTKWCAAGLARAGCARRGGRRRDRHAGPGGGAAGHGGDHLQRRQGPGAAGQRTHHRH
jgi:hypothetical protein